MSVLDFQLFQVDDHGQLFISPTFEAWDALAEHEIDTVIDLEGGLDYLKDVLIHDSLGLAAELEAQMQAVVDTYQCEWKTAVTTPEVRQRFRSFVNSDKPDEQIVFVQERGQIRPARTEERIEATA